VNTVLVFIKPSAAWSAKMAYREITYRNDEWTVSGALICADIELTLVVPGFYGPAKFEVYQARMDGQFLTGWLEAAMIAWVAENQPRLEQFEIDASQYEAA
jgi:hypothetical protein